MTFTSYRQRLNDARLAGQAPAVRSAHKKLIEAADTLIHTSHWALDPEEHASLDYNLRALIDKAHELIDLAYDYRAAIIANPPPKDGDDSPLQFS